MGREPKEYGSQERHEHAKLGTAAQDHHLGVGDERAKVRHGPQSQEDHRRDHLELNGVEEDSQEADGLRWLAREAVEQAAEGQVHKQHAKADGKQQVGLQAAANGQVQQGEANGPHDQMAPGDGDETRIKCDLSKAVKNKLNVHGSLPKSGLSVFLCFGRSVQTGGQSHGGLQGQSQCAHAEDDTQEPYEKDPQPDDNVVGGNRRQQTEVAHDSILLRSDKKFGRTPLL